MSNASGNCPYTSLPERHWWSRAVAQRPSDQVNPHWGEPPSFQISATDRIATSGSCFAQHLGRRLQRAGMNYWVTEPAPSWLDASTARQYGYGVFSTRSGNVYSTAQLLQLYRRAVEGAVPAEPVWPHGEGRFVDPFRPNIQPDGFASAEELALDRAAHLHAVAETLRNTDILVFTLGLTEAWRSKEDHSVFPVCPGCSYGDFDPGRYEFHNFRVSEVIADLSLFIEKLTALNPKVKVILTVSPVPLVATFEPKGVLRATAYSKSVLRAAAEEMELSFANVTYFGSYEIITGSFNNERYFEKDRRSVAEIGVDHVMSIFFQRFCGLAPGEAMVERPPEPAVDATSRDVICDEDLIARQMMAQRRDY